jgi:serpin B
LDEEEIAMFTFAKPFVTIPVIVVCSGLASLPTFAAERNTQMRNSEETQAITAAGNRFAFDLYGQLRSRESGNLFFSPASISTALAMTYAGAEGVTEDEMASVLHLDLAEARVHRAFASFLSMLKASGEPYELTVANRLWGQVGYDFLPEYLTTTRKYYGAELAQVDFASQPEQVRSRINTWIEEQTNDKIKDLISPGSLDRLTRLVLTNAVYFKGKWAHPFEEKATRDAPFAVSASQETDVPMMYQKRRFGYGETGEVQLLEMPYQGDELSMLIVLPKEKGSLAEIEATLNQQRLAEWAGQMNRQEVRTYVPRFTLTEQVQLTSILSALGMPSAFDPGKADFSGMNGKRDLYVSAVLHKAFVDVNEEGTEAAAATGAVVSIASIAPEPTTFRADHPFVFLIRHKPTDSILFMGRVTNPEN